MLLKKQLNKMWTKSATVDVVRCTEGLSCRYTICQLAFFTSVFLLAVQIQTEEGP